MPIELRYRFLPNYYADPDNLDPQDGQKQWDAVPGR